MQDTNPLQWDLLSPLQEICHLFCVGDDAQSIYSFRGADFRNVHYFKERVRNSEVYKLEDNYRSTQEILDISNWLLKESTLHYDKELKAVRGSGNIPIICNVENNWEEAYWISNKIIENYNNGKMYKDHLVLARSRFYTLSLQAVFIQKKIPYVTYGGQKFMESAHIRDLMSALRVVNNIDDEIAWMRFLTFWRGIGHVKATKYMNKILDLNDIKDSIILLKKMILEKDGVKISNVIKIIYENKTNLKKAVRDSYELMRNRFSEKYREDWDNKRKNDFPILSLLAENYSTLGEFINECTLDNSTKVNNSPILADSIISEGENKDHVIVSTIHSAKGLEADVCFVLNVSPKVFPSFLSLGNKDEIEEERRVLYVALTRAKNELFLTRNIHSVHTSERKLTNEANSELDDSSDEELIQETYFLNNLPEDMVEQIVIKKSKREVRDIESPNDIDLSGGLDFS